MNKKTVESIKYFLVFPVGMFGLLGLFAGLTAALENGLNAIAPSVKESESATSFTPPPPSSTLATSSPITSSPTVAAPAPEYVSNPVDWGSVGTVSIIVGLIIIGLSVIAAGVYLFAPKMWARRHVARADAEDRRAAKKAAEEERAVIKKKWSQGVAVHDELYAACQKFLFPETLEDLENRYFVVPLLDDPNVEPTRLFIDSLNKMDAAHMASPLPTTTLDDAIEYVELAQAAKRAYGAAWSNAKRLSEQGITFNGTTLSDKDKASLRKAEGALRQAMDPSTSPEVSQNYLNTMHDLLRSAGVIVPDTLAARTLELASGKLALESGK